MRAQYFLFIFFLLIPVTLAYDLNLSLECEGSFNLSQANLYKFKILNLNGTANETINFTLRHWITESQTLVKEYEQNYSLKRSKTITYQWTPQKAGTFQICGNITYSTANDSNQENDFVCKNISVQQNAQDNSSKENNTLNCDLSISINTSQIIFDAGEEINYKLIVRDNDCKNFQHDYSIKYWIEDLFGNYLKPPKLSTYSLVCKDTTSHTKKAESSCGANAYFIRAQIVDPGCNDTEPSNNFAEQLIAVRGDDPEDCKEDTAEAESESETSILDIEIVSAPKEANLGEKINLTVRLANNDFEPHEISVYSYVYSNHALISTGGWTANSQNILLDAGETKTLALTNEIKFDAKPSNYFLKARARGDNLTSDSIMPITILQAITEEEKEQANKPFQLRPLAVQKVFVTGNIIWSSNKNSALIISLILFCGLLVLLCALLILSQKRR